MALRSLFLLLSLTASAAAGVCTGQDDCKACKNCSQCFYCSDRNPHPGSCGVVRNQSGAQTADRLKKQEAAKRRSARAR